MTYEKNVSSNMNFVRNVRVRRACGMKVLSSLLMVALTVLWTCGTLALCQPPPMEANPGPQEPPQPPSPAHPPSPPPPPPSSTPHPSQSQVTSSIASLLRHHNHNVTVIVYGPRKSAYSSDVKVLEVSVAEDDPMFPGGVGVGVTPEELEAEGRGWSVVSGRVARSRVCACRQLNREAWVKEVVSRAHLFVTPLFLHDLCTLSLARREGVQAVVGVVTTRVGAWWAWHQLDLLPPLSTTPVPPGTMGDLSIWSRAANLASHYGYLTAVRQAWQVPAATTTSLPSGEGGGHNSLASLYSSLAGVLVAWDPLLDLSIPRHPAVIPVGGINLQPGLMAKEVLVPALMNRAGVVTVSVGEEREAWVGPGTQAALHHALKTTPYTILWRSSPPQQQQQRKTTTRAKFVYKAHFPLADVLNHPRHRLLISTCGETEAMAAVYFGSPVLCLPVTPDQHLSSNALQNLGLGVVLPASGVTVEKLKTALHNLTGDRRYRERGREWGEELHDQALSPDDRLLYTLERIIRRPRANTYFNRQQEGGNTQQQQQQQQQQQLYLLQQSNADVYLLLLLLLTSLLGLLICLTLSLLPVLLAKAKHKKD
ncbi:hypothetical protein Pmani_013572 [Petrolisthes manimaculis]|uniref:Uncharacterized protein n=1 Tax=Petrolisthes manimaculis TaxID=1843537 RepID=A0AAE1PWZ9_9EUCA|nr:hypothetical protein Pmani_013572 [Petrolisthes manimaculis]